MKLALLADIHGNSLALASVLRAASEESVDELLILGDMVGYYFHPDSVMEMLEPWPKVVIRGNHEESLRRAKKSQESLLSYEKRYGKGLRMAMEKLTPQQLEQLAMLSNRKRLRRGDMSILMCHGSPWDTDQYIYPDADDGLLERCFEDGDGVVVSGHTHYQMLRRVSGGLFVNPGSVGQPRDRKPGAAWALMDTESGELDLRREKYDIAAVVAEARLIHPELPYLSEVLLRQ